MPTTSNEYYSFRNNELTILLNATRKRENAFTAFRLIAFVVPVVAFFSLMLSHLPLAITILVIGFALFGWTLKRHLTITEHRKYLEVLLFIIQNEQKAIAGNFSVFPSGAEYATSEHPYASDLDIFGKASLFQYLNRTVTNLGSKELAYWLSEAAPLDEIKKRQLSVLELSKMPEWRHNLMAAGIRNRGSNNDSQRIIETVTQSTWFLPRKVLFVASICLSVIFIGALALQAPSGILSILFLILQIKGL